MTNERPLILITNDDGVWAKGINELIECLKHLGQIWWYSLPMDLVPGWVVPLHL